MSAEVLALAGFRIVAAAFAAFALVQALCNVLETLGDFDAAHFGYYLRSRLLRPGITLLVASFSGPLPQPSPPSPRREPDRASSTPPPGAGRRKA